MGYYRINAFSVGWCVGDNDFSDTEAEKAVMLLIAIRPPGYVVDLKVFILSARVSVSR